MGIMPPKQNCLQSEWVARAGDPSQWGAMGIPALYSSVFHTKTKGSALPSPKRDRSPLPKAWSLQVESAISPAEIKVNFPACLGSPGSVSVLRYGTSGKLHPAASLPLLSVTEKNQFSK